MSPQSHPNEQLLIDWAEESMARVASSAVTGLEDHESLLAQARLLPQASPAGGEWDPPSPSCLLDREFDEDLDAGEDEDELDWDDDEEDDEDWDEDEENDEDEDWDEDEEDDEDEDWGDEDDDDEDWDDEDLEDESDLEGTAHQNCL